jgi:hypothetical protein
MWILLAIAVLLLVWSVREGYVDPERRVTRPSETDATWRSKIDAAAPIGGPEEDAKYVKALQKFYDTVYVPSETKPKDTQVEDFLQTPDAGGVDKDSLRRIIVSGFSIESTTTAAQREQRQVKFQPTAAIQPKRAVDPLARDEKPYQPVDGRAGDLPEGVYAPVEQQDQPRNPGDWDSRSTSWTDAQFASVCPCAKNVV